jgi:hypothetical protein
MSFALPEPRRPAIDVAVALGIGLFMGLATYAQLRHTGQWIQANDFTYPWFGARELLAGRDPYITIRDAHLPWGPYLFYPAPAFLLVLPFAWLPAQIAVSVFIGLSAALLAVALTRDGHRWRLLALVSAPMIVATGAGQWSPLLTAAALWIPALGLLTAKPNLGVSLMAMQTNRSAWIVAALGGAVLLGVSLVVLPRWIPEWLALVRSNPRGYGYLTPIRSPLGVVLVLAALRWRRPDARMLLVMACLPQKLLFYDQLPLFLIPRTRREMEVVVLISLIALTIAYGETWTTPEATARLATIVIPSLFWPALVLVLRRRNA